MAFSFFKRDRPPAAPVFSFLQTDMHSHLIPGIDDGSPDIATSLSYIRALSAMGYRKLVTTPHILWEVYPNTPEIIATGLAELKEAVAEAGIDMELQAAAEYFIDDHFEAQLKAKAPLLPISGNLVLVEFSMITAPMDLQTVLFEMQMQNYQPVIAHPERYVYLSRKREFFDALRESGCWFQLNLLSLAGHYGNAVQELAEYLMKKGYYDLAGTDLHHARHIAALEKTPASLIKRLEGAGTFKNHSL